MTNRSFARRVSRTLSEREKAALLGLLPKFKVNLDNPYANILPQDAKKFLEIGFGTGEHLICSASNFPENYFIGADPYKNGVAKVLCKIAEQDLKNVLVWPDDVKLLLPFLPSASLAGVYIYFPDPWPKKRHKKRRLFNKDFAEELIQKLQKQGTLDFVSDVEDYAEEVWQLLLLKSDLGKATKPMVSNSLTDATSKYYGKALSRGHSKVYSVSFTKS